MNRFSAIGSLVAMAALLALTGCSAYFKSLHGSGVKVTTAKRPFTSDPANGLDTYWNLKWTKAGGTYDALVKWDMVGDYHVDASAGFVTAQNALDFGAGGNYGVQLDVMGSNPLKSYRMEASYALPGTMLLTAKIRTGDVDQVLGSLPLSQTYYTDYSIRNTGGTLSFLGRSHGIGSLQLIGSTPSPSGSEVLCVHYFAAGFGKGAELALDDYNIFNGTQPGTPAPALFVQHRIRQIQTPLFDAWSRIDRYPVDYAAVKNTLTNAKSESFQFLGELSFRFKAPGPKAYAKVQSAIKLIDSAIAQIDSGGAAASEKGRQKLLKTVAKAIKTDGAATVIVDTLK